MLVMDLNRGDVVIALKYLNAADVKPGTMGVVFERANYHGDNSGPMVRWMNQNMCNVYEGDVVATTKETHEIMNRETGEIEFVYMEFFNK